ncbi:WD40 repeat domain-containing protein [Phanerochaete sordida]|uniref:WD40 repeat domain-containing protein n=1 Tax=Phanerochaete sordida TaxID=48140 RepID=A0A9P3GG56_9APHY|nr:WD40 repeat domain-containing protein [Phanerochaete sordida]
MFTIHQTSDSRAAYKIYEASLSELGSGCPLWFPEPHVTGEPQIGDVGYVRGGAFIRLFNLNVTVDKYIVEHWPTAYKVEPQLPKDVFVLDKRNAPMGPGRFKSRGVEEIKLEGEATGGASAGSATLSASYACREVQGALLVLKSHAYGESLYDNQILEKYMVREHENWHTYATETLGHRVSQEDIVLVSGWVKAPADWATAAFSRRSTANEVYAKGQITQFFGLSLTRSRHKSHSGPQMERSGTKYPKEATSDAPKDQCVFVKRYKIKKRLGIVRIMVAGAGSHVLPPEDGGTDAARGMAASSDPEASVALFNEGEGKYVDPLDILLEYILQVSEARYAIARDEDIESILAGNAHPTDFSTYLRRRRPPVIVDDGCGRVATLDLLHQDQDKLGRTHISRSDIERWPHMDMFSSTNVTFGHAQLPQRDKDGWRDLPRFAYLRFSDTSGITKDQHCYALSRDGSMIAVVGQTPEITVWRTSDGRTLNQLKEDEQIYFITSIAFSPDGRHLVSGCGNEDLTIWDVVHGEPVTRLQGRINSINCLSFSPSGRYLAAGSIAGGLELWDYATKSSLYFAQLGSQIISLVYDSAGHQLAATVQNQVVIHDITARISVRTTIPLRRISKLCTAAFSPSGDKILICVEGEYARVYTTKRGKEVLRLEESKMKAVSAAYSPDGTTLATASIAENREVDVEVTLYESSKGTRTHKFKILSDGRSLSFSPDGAFLVVTYRHTEIAVHNARTGQLVAHLNIAERPLETRFLSDSKRIVFAYAGGPLGIVNVADTLRVH